MQRHYDVIRKPVIILDPGHGGENDRGAVNLTGVFDEATLNLEIAYMIRSRLEYFNIEWAMTRTADQSVPLSQRVKYHESVGFSNSVFISLHHNSFTSSTPYGFEIFTNVGQDESDLLSDNIFWHLENLDTGTYTRTDFSDGDADKESDKLTVIKKIPGQERVAILVEFEFLSNLDAMANYIKSRHLYAAAVADGVLSFIMKNRIGQLIL